MHPCLAAIEPARSAWPDGVDALALLAFSGIAIGLPTLGYCAMAVDIRRYLRSLRKTLVVITRGIYPGQPYWAQLDRPPCLDALDLTMPCTEEQVLAAYRVRVKKLHPDRGGDLQMFLRLQKHFEQAMYLARGQRPKARTPSAPGRFRNGRS